jgi:excisionase family DNA binding protein
MTARKNKSDSDPQVKTATDVRALLPMERCNFEIAEAAQVLCLSRSGVYDLIAEGKLATVAHGRRRIVPGAELARVVEDFAKRRTFDSGVKPRKRMTAA